MNRALLAAHILNATPANPPSVKRSLYWAVAVAFILGIIFGRFGSLMQ